MAISVKLNVFEGPLDLLLHLIEKNKIDIFDIPIVEITEQYMDYDVLPEYRSLRGDANVSNAVGVAGLVSELLMPVLQNVGNFGLVVFSWLTGVLVDMLMTPLAGMAAFSPLFIEIAQKLGLSATGVTFSFVWGVEQLFFPYEWALFLILFSYDVFDTKKAIKFCTVRTILSLIFLVVLIYPYWMLTGFLK